MKKIQYIGIALAMFLFGTIAHADWIEELYSNDCNGVSSETVGAVLIENGGADGSNAYQVTDEFFATFSRGTKEEVTVAFDLNYHRNDGDEGDIKKILFTEPGGKNTGPCLELDNGVFQYRVDSTSCIKYGELKADTWYHFMLKGYMSDSIEKQGMQFEFSVYEYGEEGLIQQFDGVIQTRRSAAFVYRNGFGGIQFKGTGMLLDNIKVTQQSPEPCLTVKNETYFYQAPLRNLQNGKNASIYVLYKDIEKPMLKQVHLSAEPEDVDFIAEKEGKYFVKAYLWDCIEGMVPLAEPVIYLNTFDYELSGQAGTGGSIDILFKPEEGTQVLEYVFVPSGTTGETVKDLYDQYKDTCIELQGQDKITASKSGAYIIKAKDRDGGIIYQKIEISI